MIMAQANFSNFGSLKSTETAQNFPTFSASPYFSNFGSLKSTETDLLYGDDTAAYTISAISAR